MFPNPPGLLRLEPHSEGLRDRIWWGAATNATAEWAAKLGMNLQSSTLKFDESGKPFHIQQAEQIRKFRAAWKEAGHAREPRVSVSRSIFALVDDRDRAYFGRSDSEDHFGYIEPEKLAVFGRSYAAEPDVLIEQLKGDEAIAEADTLLLTVPNQLGVRLQRARHRGDPDPRRAGVGVAVRLATCPSPLVGEGGRPAAQRRGGRMRGVGRAWCWRASRTLADVSGGISTTRAG